MSAITVSQRDGRVVAVKSAQGPDSALRLAHEADILGRLDHPGIVQLVDHVPGDSGHLTTIFVGPETWDQHLPTDETVLTNRLSMLAATIADLHDSGVAHGNITLEHIITRTDGRPILCGLGGALAADSASITADHDGLAEVFRAASSEISGATHATCQAIAGALAAGTTNARAVTQQLDALARSEPISNSRRPGNIQLGAMGAAALVSLTLIGWFLFPGRPPVDDVAAPPVPSSTSLAPSVVDEPVPAPTTVPPPVPGPNAPQLSHNGRQYALGQAGDIVVAHDWNCDGLATPALLRPETGDVAVFALWPTPDQAIVADSVTTVSGATRFIIADNEPCPELRLQTPSGSRLIETSFP